MTKRCHVLSQGYNELMTNYIPQRNELLTKELVFISPAIFTLVFLILYFLATFILTCACECLGTFHTSSIYVLHLVDQACRKVLNNSRSNTWKKNRKASQYCTKRVKKFVKYAEMGLALVCRHVIKFLQIIWGWSSYRWILLVSDLQMSCRDLLSCHHQGEN